MIPPRLVRLGVFVVYALTLVTLTHWPALTIDNAPIERPDLVIHVGAFGLWTVLLWASELLGPMHRPMSALRAGAIAGAYSLVDELTQGIPILKRTVALSDALANLTGVILAGAALLVLTCFVRTRDAEALQDRSARDTPTDD